MENGKTAALLNDLIETVKDGEMGFKTAAEGVQDPNVKTVFEQFSQQRSRIAAELQQEVQAFGEQPEESGSVSGSLHRGWINIKQAVTGKDEGAIIAEAERGEDVAKEAFEKALEADLPANIRELIGREYAEIKSAHDTVRDMERAYKQS